MAVLVWLFLNRNWLLGYGHIDHKCTEYHGGAEGEEGLVLEYAVGAVCSYGGREKREPSFFFLLSIFSYNISPMSNRAPFLLLTLSLFKVWVSVIFCFVMMMHFWNATSIFLYQDQISC